MGITVKRTGKKLRFDVDIAAKIISTYAVGAVLRRVDRGMSLTGAAFAPYSRKYREALIKGGETTKVDLRVTGGLMSSLKAVTFTKKSIGEVDVRIRVGTGTSPAVSLGGGRAKRTGGRSPPHNVLAYWLHHGNGNTPARPFLGLTDAEERTLLALLTKANLWR
jgi:hypothetical protein